MSDNKHWHWNFFYDKYPYTDFHELNLDWLIESIHYWYVCIRKLQDAIGLNNEDHNRYWSKDYKEGDLVWYKDGWKRLLHDVKEGDIIDCSDFESISVEELLAEERAARIAADEAEKAARIAADNKERAERIAADDALDDRIDKEIADRTAADTAEKDARESADTAIGQRIDKEITDRTNADVGLQTQITSNDTDIADIYTKLTTAQNTANAAQSAATAAQTTANSIINSAPITNIYNTTGTSIVGKVAALSFASVKTNIDGTTHRGKLFTANEAYAMLGSIEGAGDPSRIGVYVYNGDYNAYASGVYAGYDASDATYYAYAITPVSGTVPMRVDVFLTIYSGDGVYIDYTV